MRSSHSKLAAIMLCLMLAFGTLALAGCGGGGNADQLRLLQAEIAGDDGPAGFGSRLVSKHEEFVVLAFGNGCGHLALQVL